MVKITILIDNNAPEGTKLVAEHGFSALIEDHGKKLLFDAGASNSFLANAHQLGIDLSDVTTLIISHAHWDHSGGVIDFVAQWKARQKSLYVGQHFFQKHYSVRTSLVESGAPFDCSYLEQEKVAVHYCHSIEQITPHCFVVSGFERSNTIEKANERFVIQHGKEVIVDEFSDECALVVKQNEELNLLVGCAHIGILNMVEHIEKQFGLPVVGVYGGIHLMDSSRDYITTILEHLAMLKVNSLGLCHCSGEEVHTILGEEEFSHFKRVAMESGQVIPL